MRLRYAADRRTLLWFAAMSALAAAQYAWPRVAPWALPLSLYFGFCAGVLAHNHNHCPVFEGRRSNALYAQCLSVFYGYPVFAWIPTHNLNHHKFVNGRGDVTITWRHTNENTWTVASTYFFVSAFWQSGLIRHYVRSAQRANRARFRSIVAQYTFVAVAHAALLALALTLHGWRRGLLVYVCAFAAPAIFALWSMMFMNYIQHVHCDPGSEHDHSRNFVSKVGNFLVFNNGFHAAHHESPGVHWSKLPERHARIEASIASALKQQSIWAFCLKSYLLGALDRRFRTRQMGRVPLGDAPAAVAALPAR